MKRARTAAREDRHAGLLSGFAELSPTYGTTRGAAVILECNPFGPHQGRAL
jgi:hypothetical protein